MSYKKSFSFVQPARCWVALLIAFWLVASLSSITSRPPLPVAAQNEPDPTEIWDMAEIKNPLTLNAAVVAGPTRARINRVSMEVIEVTFDSIDVGQGPIRIHGFVAIPTGHAPGTLPALVYGHGAGDQADEEVAKTLAAMLKAVTISFSGPGQGRSTGAPSQWRNWLNTIPDIRRSWLYQYAYSAMRAVTYLTTLPAVNRQKIGMTGISAGGLMTWIANGVDDRLAAAYPIMATGDFRRSLEAGSWVSLLMSETGLTPESPPVLAFERYLDPIHYVGRQHAPVMLINGAQDEFFPITTTRSTYEATRAPEKRLEIIYDWDHGYYADSSRRYDTYNNVVNASKRILGNAQAWFDWHLRDGQPLPPDPQLSVRQQGNETVFIVPGALVAGARKVQLIYSRDRAYTFEREPMRRQSDGSYTVSLTGDTSRLVYYVEAEYPGSVYVSSLPEFPPGFVPRIRPPQ
ncbi:MAG: acetylxylan esterase [Acidobacteriota bacterium]|nr:acetylxylan esterase [Acidobacteriota bacterium]